MQITVVFETMDEFEAFRTSGKKTRTKKEEADEAATGNAPAPLQPAFNPGGAAPAAAGFPGAGGAFPAPAGPAPEVLSIVSRIISKTDASLQAGQGTPEQVLQWFRNQCGPEAASMTLDQVKTIALPRLPMPTLENMAKLIAA